MTFECPQHSNSATRNMLLKVSTLHEFPCNPQDHSSTSEFRGDGLRESAGRPRGETLRGLGDRPSRLRLSGLSPLGEGALRGEILFRGLGLRRVGEALTERLLLRRSSS